ncbi:MAG: PilZ domain-containing protein [Luteimonas sp.]
MDQVIEQRRHPRREILNAILIRPNGDQHEAQVLDVSLGGARMRLPEDWNPHDGAHVRMYFLPDSDDAITLDARVTRVGIDHMGVAFAPEQEDRILALLDAISDRPEP